MPDIDNPQTFAEWYWRNSVDAQRARSASYEKTLAPLVGDVLNSIAGVEGLPSYMQSFLHTLAAPPEPDWDTSVVRFAADLGGGLLQRILGHEVKEFDYHMAHYLRNVRITHDVANELYLRKKITEEFWQERNLDAGYSEAEMLFNYEARKPYPNMQEIIAYARYHGPPEAPKEIAWKLYDISPDDWDLWDWLSWQKLNTEQVLKLYCQGWWTETVADTELARLGWQLDDRRALHNLAYELPNPMLLMQGDLIRGATEDEIIRHIKYAGIHPSYAEHYLEGVLTKPASTDIVAYQLRKDPALSVLPSELRKIGIHPAYHELYKELAYPIPPIADIITMAVREAFTPAIAARFGQYEDLPPDFVSWAQKKGLSKDWAERYWAAHWSLPSATQGFEMLHRGVINRDELSLLLRALDVMPFWREKLMRISYRTLTRVDVRRMYGLGVLTEAEVKSAYMELGYDATNADRMTRFTVKLIEAQREREREKEVKEAEVKRPTWTAAQTLSFVKKGIITVERATQELHVLGYDAEHINVYLASAKPAP